jgi:hypothetical protein
MDATVTAYRQQGFFVWAVANDTHVCSNNSSAAACHAASDTLSGAEVALTHVNASTHGVPFVKEGCVYQRIERGCGFQVQESALGKGFAWEMVWAAHRGDWQRVLAMQRFIGQWTYAFRSSTADMRAADTAGKYYVGECYYYGRYLQNRPISGEPNWPVLGQCSGYESDPGNGEQVSWFVWGTTIVRRLLYTAQ